MIFYCLFFEKYLMKDLFKLLYSPSQEKVEVKIPEFKKGHKGGCLIYSLANLLNEKPENISEIIKRPLDYWFEEEEIFELEKLLPIRIYDYKREKVIESLRKNKSVIFCFDNHCLICYGYELRKELLFFLFDVNGKRKKMKERNIQYSIVIYSI